MASASPTSPRPPIRLRRCPRVPSGSSAIWSGTSGASTDGRPGSSRAPASSLPTATSSGWWAGGPSDAELVAWFSDGHRALVQALMSAPADLEAWTFLDAPTPLAFWARRQAHETAIHRVDAESAAGDVTGFPSGFAADGIDELLLRFVARKGKTLPVDEPRSMLVRASDVPRSWRVTFAPTGFQVQTDPADADADLVVTAGASDLYTLLWNRRDPTGSALRGETDVLDLWRSAVRSPLVLIGFLLNAG